MEGPKVIPIDRLLERREILQLAAGACFAPLHAGTSRDGIIIEAQGDSLTAGRGAYGIGPGQGPYPLQLARLLSVRYGRPANVINRGVGGVGPRFCAARANAVPMKFSVEGDQLPRSGPVPLTWFDAQPITDQAPQPLIGSYIGIRGVLKAGGFSSTGNPLNMTFTREQPGEVQFVAPRSTFMTDLGTEARSRAKLMVYGRNGMSIESIVAAIDGDIKYQDAPLKRWLVGSVLTAVPEVQTDLGNKIRLVNSTLAARYGAHYVDLDTPPSDVEMRTLGFSPTKQDRAEIDLGVIPNGMRFGGPSANQHLNNFGYALWALRFDSRIAQLCWYSPEGHRRS